MANAYYVNQYISTTLATVGGITAVQTSDIQLQSVTNIETTKPGIACISYTNPIDSTVAEWVTYTSIDGSNKLVGVTRGAEGYAAKAHANGATIAFPISRSHINNLNDALIIDGAETNLVTGVISPTGTSSDPATELVTKSYADGGLVNSMSRQASINGNFTVCQRFPTTRTVINPAGNSFLADHFKIEYTFTTPPANIVHSILPLTPGEIPGSFYHYRIAVDGAGSDAANNLYFLRQWVENGVRFLCGTGKKVTLSFKSRSNIASKRLGVAMFQNYGAGGSPTSQETLQGKAVTLTSSWQDISHTFTTNTLTGKTFGTDNDDRLGFILTPVWGSNLGSTFFNVGDTETFRGAGYVDIAQVQLCAGDVALPFQPKSYEEELRSCKRYFSLLPAGSIGHIVRGTLTRTDVFFLPSTPMRTGSPALALIAGGTFTNLLTVQGTANYTPTGVALAIAGTNGISLAFTGHASGTANDIAEVQRAEVGLDNEL